MTVATHDAALTIGLIGTFAVLVAVHVINVFGIARKRRFGEALGALVIPPLAPYFAFTQGMPVRAIAWIASAALYAVAFLLNYRT